jgi:hypothetical protein
MLRVVEIHVIISLQKGRKIIDLSGAGNIYPILYHVPEPLQLSIVVR